MILGCFKSSIATELDNLIVLGIISKALIILRDNDGLLVAVAREARVLFALNYLASFNLQVKAVASREKTQLFTVNLSDARIGEDGYFCHLEEKGLPARVFV